MARMAHHYISSTSPEKQNLKHEISRSPVGNKIDSWWRMLIETGILLYENRGNFPDYNLQYCRALKVCYPNAKRTQDYDNW
jgi:hypothetical protein